MLRYLIFLSLIFLGFIFRSGYNLPEEVTSKLYTWSLNHPQEKVYLHTDKPFYVAGEDLWFKAYVMIGPYTIPDTISSVLYVEIIDQDHKVSDRRFIHLREGLGYGDFSLSKNLLPGKYTLRAYTKYMQNYDPAFYFRRGFFVLPYYGKNAEIINSQSATGEPGKDSTASLPVHISFYPEGGDLTADLQNYVAFKATGKDGHGVEVEGTVKNSHGKEILKFKSKKFGLGYFSFNPDAGEKYTAVVNFDRKEYSFSLPVARPEGYTIHVHKSEKDVFIWVRNNRQANMKGSFVVGEFRGIPFVTIHAKPDSKFIYSVLNTKDIPAGIMHFTFFDSLGIPHCERLVYNENENDKIDFTYTQDHNVYHKRQKGNFTIHCSDLSGKPVLTNISVSVTDTLLVNPDENRSNIMSYFDLESDLKGNIENPGYYFNPENTDRMDLIEILMMTHGWRRFVWKEILENPSSEIKYLAEAGFSVKGRLVNFYDPSKLQPGFVRLFIFENKLYYAEMQTDSTALFEFDGIDIRDSTQVVIQAWRHPHGTSKRKERNSSKIKNDFVIQIEPQAFEKVYPDLQPGFISRPGSTPAYQQMNDYILKLDSAFGQPTVLLGEVTVKGKKYNTDPYERPNKLYKTPSNRIIMDSLSSGDRTLNLFQLISKKVPGITVRGAPPGLQILIRGPISLLGSSEPLIMLDGIPVESDFMYDYPPNEIAFIDVLNTSNSAIYGGNTGNGIIAFYSRTGSVVPEEEERKGIINFSYPGYYLAREFYSPDYDIKDEQHARPDFRRTLYWNPTLTTNDKGDINYSFFMSDETGVFRVQIEGMTHGGMPVKRDYYLEIK